MALYFGNQKIKNRYIGTKKLSARYFGTRKIWSSVEERVVVFENKTLFPGVTKTNQQIGTQDPSIGFYPGVTNFNYFGAGTIGCNTNGQNNGGTSPKMINKITLDLSEIPDISEYTKLTVEWSSTAWNISESGNATLIRKISCGGKSAETSKYHTHGEGTDAAVTHVLTGMTNPTTLDIEIDIQFGKWAVYEYYTQVLSIILELE